MTKPEDNTAPIDDTADTSIADESQDVEETSEDWDEAFDDLYGSDEKEEEEEADDSEDDSSEESEDEKNNSAKENVVKNNDSTEKEEKEADPAEEQRAVVKDALKEVYSEQQAEEAQMQETIREALSIVRPEGIQDPRVDSDGDPIKGPEDVEKLYNPETNELFTPSEARAWYEKATQKYERELQEAAREAEHVARVNQRLQAGREAVIRNYGEFIEQNPEIAQKVLARYMATMKIAGEGENQYVADAPVDILEFYNDVMYPYVELAEKRKEAEEAAAAAAKAKEEANKRAKAHRDESRDFHSSVNEEATKSGDELDWDDAFKQYYGNR